MNIKGLTSRIRRLEPRIKGAGCEACVRTALKQLVARRDPTITAPDRCPECDNPNPKIPIRVAHALVLGEVTVSELIAS